MVKKLIFLLTIAVGLGMGAQAFADIPANSALNPVSQNLYVINRSALSVRTYDWTGIGWAENVAAQSLPGASLGMTVSPDGTKLYVSSNGTGTTDGSTKGVRVISLDVSGHPTASDYMTGAYWASYSSPAGMAVGGNNRLFVADSNVGRIRVFNTGTNTWVPNVKTYTSIGTVVQNPLDNAITGAPLSGKSTYSIAVTSTADNIYKIFATERVNNGSIYVYNYDAGTDTATYLYTINGGLVYPTYLKIAGNNLFVAVDGTDGVDIKVYDINSYALVGDVKSGIVGNYGWVGFDVSPDGAWLVFKKAKKADETSNGLYRIKVANISGTVTADEVTVSPSIEASDSVAISLDRTATAVANSLNGKIQVYPNIATNHAPPDPTNLKQLKLDGVTEIPCPDGITDQTRVIASFDMYDNIDHELLRPVVAYRRFNIEEPWILVTGEVVAGSDQGVATGTVTIPASTVFDNGSYTWKAGTVDPYGMMSLLVPMGGVESGKAFTVFVSDDISPEVVTDLSAAPGTGNGEIIASWTVPADNRNVTKYKAWYSYAGAITEGNLSSAMPYSQNWAAKPTGERETFTMSNLTPGAHIWIAIKALDAVGNASILSNSPDTIVKDINATGPVVTSIDPDNGVQGQTVTVINLRGSNFAQLVAVKLSKNGNDINATSVNRVSATTITCTIPIPANAEVGTWDVSVTNNPSIIPMTGTLPAAFTVNAPGTAPTITGIDPAIGVRNAPIAMTITGTNFDNVHAGTTAYLARTGQSDINGSATVNSPTSITFNFTVPATAQVGYWSLIVRNPDGQKALLYNSFNVVSDINTIPTVTQLYPRRAPNSAVTVIKIVGTNFNGTTAVDLQTIPASALSYTVDSATRITATVPAGMPVGIFNTTVTNASGASIRTAVDTFEVTNGNENPPVASQVTNLTATAGNTTVTLNWTNPTDNDMGTIEVRQYTGAFPAAHDATGTVLLTDIPTPGASMALTDTGLTNGTTYYYVVFIQDTSGNWSLVDSTTPGVNAASATPSASGEVNPSITLTFDATRGNIFWISIPYNTPYTKASQLIADINAQVGQAADSGNYITSIGRWDGKSGPQVYQSYDFLQGLGWSGTDFDLVTGESVYLNVATTTTMTLKGTNNPNFVFNLPYDAARGNIFWVSLPYRGDYTDAVSVIADINVSAGLPADSGNVVTSIGRWSGTANPQIYESYDFLAGLGWSGTNFNFVSGEGYYVNIAANMDKWKPKVK